VQPTLRCRINVTPDPGADVSTWQFDAAAPGGSQRRVNPPTTAHAQIQFIMQALIRNTLDQRKDAIHFTGHNDLLHSHEQMYYRTRQAEVEVKVE